MTIRNFISAALIMILTAGVSPARAQQTINASDKWRTFAEQLEPSAFVRVRLKDGASIKGTLLQVGTDALLVKPRTRVPVPARSLALSEIRSIQRQKAGMTPGMKVVTGVGIAGAVLLAWGLLALAGSN